jgi:lysophospholipid acyltransferase (LPLAT)-like uncharacterized protein
MQESPLTPAQNRKARIIAATASPLVGALGATWRLSVHGVPSLASLFETPRQPILAFWHGRILTGIHFFRDRDIVVITSRNFDGEWIARIIHRFGFGSARGSSSRGGARALVQLRRALQAGRSVAFPLDGPRGPARVAQPGAVWLAGATGHPLVPIHMEADRYWEARSWDRTQIPKPFSRSVLVFGEPIFVPGTDDTTVEVWRRRLEASLAELERQALGLVGRAPATPKESKVS